MITNPYTRKQLTEQQLATLLLMRQRGMWATAQFAEEAWKRGERYYIDLRVRYDKTIRGQFRKANETAVMRGN